MTVHVILISVVTVPEKNDLHCIFLSVRVFFSPGLDAMNHGWQVTDRSALVAHLVE